MNSNKLIAFAEDCVSFLIERADLTKIKNIILFGSVARKEASKDSDIDIFIDTVFDIKKDILKLRDDFYDSAKYKSYWELFGIKNEIKLTIGDLDKWDLKPSIIANGIVLYGSYKEMPKNAEHKVLFVWENIKPESARVMFNKKIFGYKHAKKFYKGFLQNYGGNKIGKGCVLVPLQYSIEFRKILKKYKISAKIKNIIEY